MVIGTISAHVCVYLEACQPVLHKEELTWGLYSWNTHK